MPKLKIESNMPNEKMERDPSEEKQTTDTWYDFNQVEDR
jgi:hypothetical protein